MNEPRYGLSLAEPAVRRLVEATIAFQAACPEINEVRFLLGPVNGRPALWVTLGFAVAGVADQYLLTIPFSAAPVDVPRHCKRWVWRLLGAQLEAARNGLLAQRRSPSTVHCPPSLTRREVDRG